MIPKTKTLNPKQYRDHPLKNIKFCDTIIAEQKQVVEAL